MRAVKNKVFNQPTTRCSLTKEHLVKAIDYTGQKIGHLTVKHRGLDREFDSSRAVQWVCDCECGKEVTVLATLLSRHAPTLSCGCFNFSGPHKNSKHTPVMSSFLALFNRNKQAAHKRGIAWDLPLTHFIEVVTRPCCWCECAPFMDYNGARSRNGYTQRKHTTPHLTEGTILVNGLDRIDNSAGYTPENVTSACKYCNFARNDRTQEEFRVWLKQIARIHGVAT